MPVEINELVIRGVVETPCGDAVAGTPGGAGPAEAGSSAAGGLSAAERQALVAASVHEVLKILRRTKER